jgi:type IV secretory pathway TraG/TraD family ATPase VirD4
MFWAIAALTAGLVVALAVTGRRLVGGAQLGVSAPGYASAAQVRRHLSARAVLARAPQVRPSVASRCGSPAAVGIPLGRDAATGTELWGSVEDSYLILGPPRSGKGVSLIVPGLLATAGPALITATRPDTYRATVAGRANHGPVAVFDPQHLSQGSTGLALRWSPVAGCQDPQVAILRARGLAAGAGFAHATTDADFWTGSSAAVIRCYLHAAALAELSVTDVLSWIGRPADPTPIALLRRYAHAAPGWAEELAAQAAADPRQRDGVWAGVRRAFDSLADPRVLAACSPPPHQAFDPAAFLAERGTLYLLGSTGAQLSVAPLVAALVEDLVETARRQAAAGSTGRLDPPATLWLDEAANIAPLPSLPSLLADGGGSGLCTIAVFQSLAQARAAWREEAAGAMWDAATIKIIFGGLGHADDLARISRLAGDVDQPAWTHSDGAGGRSWSRTLRRLPALPVERLRNLPEGRAILLHRRTPPIETILAPWWQLPCRQVVEASIGHTQPRRSGSDARAN